MKLLREYIRSLLTEDPMGFVHDLAAASKSGEFGEDFFGGDPGKAGGRAIKKAFAKHADHKFLSTLDTVHWTDAYGMKGLTQGKDELSATMSLPGEKFYPAGRYDVGLWIKGRITLAANDQDEIYTGKWDDYMHFADAEPATKLGKSQRHRQKSSGVNKLPTVSKDYSRYDRLKPGNEFMEKIARNIPYVLDQSTWNPSRTNEALVDNWKPVGVVVDDDSSGSRIEAVKYHAQDPLKAVGMVKQLFQVAAKFGVPLYDIDRNELWSPEERI